VKANATPERKHSDLNPIRPEEIPKLEAAMRFVRENFADGIVLQDAARVAGISRFYFLRRFKLHFGKTPKTVAAERQIEVAKRFLLAGFHCGRVAKECGYSHQPHFCTRFLKAVGMTPTAWVAAQRKAKQEQPEEK
jgi:AraC family transcriptional regulator